MVKDVQDATDGLGPDAAVITPGDVRCGIISNIFDKISNRLTDNAVQPSHHVFAA